MDTGGLPEQPMVHFDLRHAMDIGWLGQCHQNEQKKLQLTACFLRLMRISSKCDLQYVFDDGENTQTLDVCDYLR